MITACRATAVVLAALALSAYLSGGAAAHGGASGVVKERMEAMKRMATSMKALSLPLKDADAYDPGEAMAHGRTIAAHADEELTELFPDDSLDAPSEALPEIWADWDRFEELAGELRRSADAFVAAVERNGDAFPKREFVEMGRTCGACHRDFRASDNGR